MPIRILFLVLLLCVLLPSAAQQTALPPPQPQDTHAVDVISRVLVAAGGASAINAIEDYTATGHIVYHFAADVHGTVKVRGNGFDQLRIDAILPAGVRSEIINRGTITLKTEDGAVGEIGSQAPMVPTRLILPTLLLAPILQSATARVSYQNVIEIDGHSAHDLRLQLLPPDVARSDELTYRSVEFTIDASSFQVLVMQDTVSRQHIRHLRYSDYRTVAGVLVPFLIRESIDDRPTWVMQLDTIAFNSGLQDSDFNP